MCVWSDQIKIHLSDKTVWLLDTLAFEEVFCLASEHGPLRLTIAKLLPKYVEGNQSYPDLYCHSFVLRFWESTAFEEASQDLGG